MKIVEINTVGNGCTGRIAFSIKKVLEQNGHECIFAVGRGNFPNTMRIGNNLEMLFHLFMTRIFDTCGLHSYFGTKKLLRFLDNYNPDIIHLHNLHGYYINYKLLFDYIKKNEIRVFWTLHDCWPFTGHCPYYDYVNCNKWVDVCCNCIQKHHHPKSVFIDRSYKNYLDKKNAFTGVKDLTIITPSKWLKEEVGKSFLKEYKIVNIHNGIDLSVFHPTSKKFRSDNKIGDRIMILGVANLWADTKGLSYFLELSKELPLDRFVIVLVGLKESQMKKIPNSIIAMKKTENFDMLVDIYSSADVFVNPTLEDNFPTTNIEALACGTPIITFNTGGSPECIAEGCGSVCEKDINSLLSACKQIKRKTKDTESLCIEQSKKFDENTCYGNYLKLYESI